MTRLLFLQYNIKCDCKELKAQNRIKPIGPLAVDKTDGSRTKIYIFQDPDGFVLYWAEIPSHILKLSCGGVKRRYQQHSIGPSMFWITSALFVCVIFQRVVWWLPSWNG